MAEILHNYPYAIIVLAVLIGIYSPTFLKKLFKISKVKKDIRDFIKKRKLTPDSDSDVLISSDLLEQMFLADYPQHRNTLDFHQNFHTNISKYILFKDGYYYINKNSYYSKPPTPPVDYPPLPEGFYDA